MHSVKKAEGATIGLRGAKAFDSLLADLLVLRGIELPVKVLNGRFSQLRTHAERRAALPQAPGHQGQQEQERPFPENFYFKGGVSRRGQRGWCGLLRQRGRETGRRIFSAHDIRSHKEMKFSIFKR
jgi:hypothetical protein